MSRICLVVKKFKKTTNPLVEWIRSYDRNTIPYRIYINMTISGWMLMRNLEEPAESEDNVMTIMSAEASNFIFRTKVG